MSVGKKLGGGGDSANMHDGATANASKSNIPMNRETGIGDLEPEERRGDCGSFEFKLDKLARC